MGEDQHVDLANLEILRILNGWFKEVTAEPEHKVLPKGMTREAPAHHLLLRLHNLRMRLSKEAEELQKNLHHIGQQLTQAQAAAGADLLLNGIGEGYRPLAKRLDMGGNRLRRRQALISAVTVLIVEELFLRYPNLADKDMIGMYDGWVCHMTADQRSTPHLHPPQGSSPSPEERGALDIIPKRI